MPHFFKNPAPLIIISTIFTKFQKNTSNFRQRSSCIICSKWEQKAYIYTAGTYLTFASKNGQGLNIIIILVPNFQKEQGTFNSLHQLVPFFPVGPDRLVLCCSLTWYSQLKPTVKDHTCSLAKLNTRVHNIHSSQDSIC